MRESPTRVTRLIIFLMSTVIWTACEDSEPKPKVLAGELIREVVEEEEETTPPNSESEQVSHEVWERVDEDRARTIIEALGQYRFEDGRSLSSLLVIWAFEQEP